MAVGITNVFEVDDAKQIAAMARSTFDKYFSNFQLLDFVLQKTSLLM